jgi:exonuclease III
MMRNINNKNETMKILSYNISQYSQAKIDLLLQQDADVLILPEMACQEMVTLPDGYKMVWVGDKNFKGLGIIYKAIYSAEVPLWYKPEHQYFLPLLVDGILVMAAWPTHTEHNKPKGYPRIAMEAILDYEQQIKEYPTIIVGDMNCYKGQSGETKKYSIETIASLLDSWGLASAYHQKYNEKIGKESIATYHHLFIEEKTFFLDYVFSSVPIKDYQLLPWNRNFSDHAGQVIVV